MNAIYSNNILAYAICENDIAQLIRKAEEKRVEDVCQSYISYS